MLAACTCGRRSVACHHFFEFRALLLCMIACGFVSLHWLCSQPCSPSPPPLPRSHLSLPHHGKAKSFGGWLTWVASCNGPCKF